MLYIVKRNDGHKRPGGGREKILGTVNADGLVSASMRAMGKFGRVDGHPIVVALSSQSSNADNAEAAAADADFEAGRDCGSTAPPPPYRYVHEPDSPSPYNVVTMDGTLVARCPTAATAALIVTTANRGGQASASLPAGHETFITFTIGDEAFELNCSCGWKVLLPDDPSPDKVLAAVEEHAAALRVNSLPPPNTADGVTVRVGMTVYLRVRGKVVPLQVQGESLAVNVVDVARAWPSTCYSTEAAAAAAPEGR